jgi:hypothetical protein
VKKEADLDLLNLVRDEKDSEKSFEEEYVRQLTPREIDIDVEYTAPDGRTYRWKLRSEILGGQSRVTVGRAAATMVGGVPWESVPPATQSLAYMLAWVAKAIVNMDKLPSFSKWVQEDTSLLLAVYEEVQAHEAKYFQRNIEASIGDTSKPAIRVASIASAKAKGNGEQSSGLGLVPGGE